MIISHMHGIQPWDNDPKGFTPIVIGRFIIELES